ncbi:valine--tRNA ligase, mitochondrial isoform X2 [Conger conger]|nr:valine--tRNA ligase, mitochondrial isoform X2 [Conger conger]
MWGHAAHLSARAGGTGSGRARRVWEYRHCAVKSGTVYPYSSSSSPSSSSQSPSTRKQLQRDRRQREKENSILNSKHTNVEDEGMRWREKEKIVYSAPTSPGEKKDTSLPFPPSYSPQFVESSWYQWWEKEGLFTPEYQDRLPHAVNRPFALCIPPPNVTGTLHLGHALTVAIQDAIVRWRRMLGYRVLWVPGCDHAGIATQAVVERKLLKDHGRCRQDYSREEFLQEVWKWKNEKGDEIYHQLKMLGASLDWSRACFTMDPGFSRSVTEAFVRLGDSGLIQRSEALVNWSCALGSAISDIEVDTVELSGRTLRSVPGYENNVEFGTLVTFAYPIEGQGGEVSVSTTRPETMLGDVAIAVHPDDPRYQSLHHKECRHPFTDRLLPILPDPLVNMELGTGAVKVTPAHDHTDFLLSQKHSLPRVTVIGGDGRMTALCGQWLEGVKRFDARERVISALMEREMFRGKMDHSMILPVCSRSGDVIEPLLKKQWFVRCEEMATRAMQAVDDGELEIMPHFYKKTWRNWLSNISDWCISRQLWWGHQIPAYQVALPGEAESEEERWVWGRDEAEARQRAAVRFGVNPDSVTLTRDPDVLDTWFSSALFPFAMLGWPEQTSDLQQFYPNSLLETGSDLIFFWVARMVMLGTELTGQLPFRQVLLHSLVRDKHGRKMSKSLGNVIDPLDVMSGISLQRLLEKVKEGNLDPRETSVAMEAQRRDFPRGIPECGTDALRFALCSYKLQGEDISLSVSQVLSSRHFCNKMWQTLRFTLSVLGSHGPAPGTLAETTPLSSIDRWICSRLRGTVLQCERGFQSCDLQAVTSALHSFWLHGLCDVYLECIKPVLGEQDGAPGRWSDAERESARGVLFHCVSISLALFAPFMPFLTEELWQRLQAHRPAASAAPAASLSVQPYPQPSQLDHWHFPQEEADFSLVQEVVRVTRSLRAQCHLTKARPDLWVVCSPSQAQSLLNFSSAARTLGRVSSLHLHCPPGAGQGPEAASAPPPPGGCAVGVVDHTCQLHLDVQGIVNVDGLTTRLSQHREKVLTQLEQCVSRTRVLHYTEKVPERVRQETEKKISALEQELTNIQDQLLALQGLRNKQDS